MSALKQLRDKIDELEKEKVSDPQALMKIQEYLSETLLKQNSAGEGDKKPDSDEKEDSDESTPPFGS